MVWSTKDKAMDEKFFQQLFDSFSQKLEQTGHPLPSVSIVAEENNDPYRILVSTILSLRTRDKVTLERSNALFEKAHDFKELEDMEEEKLAEIIKPVAFYTKKASDLKNIARIINTEHGGKVPSDLESLLKLPGVGIKTASLTLNLGFNMEAICVDCHVHQILNRLGVVDTRTAEETERELRKILPRKFWIPLNEVLVRYGQSICTPISPWCSQCPSCSWCPKKEVAKHR